MPACPALCVHEWVATWPMFPRLRFWEDGVRCDKESRRCHRSCCRREGALSGLGFAGHRGGRLEFDCTGGRSAYALLVGVLRYSMFAVASHRPSDGRSLCVCVPSARQVHALPANARMVAHVGRARMLGRACQDASLSRTRRPRMHTKAIAMQGLGVGMGMVQSSASPRLGLYLVIGGGMDMPHCASTGLGLGYGPATHSTAGMEQPAATMCAHADWFCSSLQLWCCSA